MRVQLLRREFATRHFFGELALSLLSTILLSCPQASAAPTFGYRIVATYPHSTDSYTEGFFYLDGIFYESIGIKGRSALMAVAVETGRALQRHDLPPQY
jgi:glutamine cyclotransferase